MRLDRNKRTLNDCLNRQIFAGIRVGTRKLKSSFSLETTQDYSAMHGIDTMDLLIEGLQHEMSEQMDRAILDTMISTMGMPHKYQPELNIIKVLHV